VVPAVARANALNLVVDSASQSFAELIQATTASIDLTSLTVALSPAGNADPWNVSLELVSVPNGTTAGNCRNAETAVRTVQAFALHPGETATLSMPSPLVVAPPAGQTRCLLVASSNATGAVSNNFGLVFVSATGYVVSGTYSGPHGT
jgi:hypothetical protein